MADLKWDGGTLLGFFTKLFNVAKSWGLSRQELLALQAIMLVASSGWGLPEGGVF